MCIFNELKEYINSKNIGYTIYRKDFKSIFGSYGAGLDVYRRQLTILGYLYSIKPGQYEIKKHLPESFNTIDSKTVYCNKRISLKNKKF